MSRCDPGAAPSAGELIARYDAHAPRYTSYPTAAQFTPAVGAETWAGWLAAAPDEPASLYVHIPFCKRLCWYCGCNTRAMNRAESISAYVDLVLKEAALTARAAGRRIRIGRLHLGGGTPNMLSPDDLARLMAGLSKVFDLSGLGEFAAELDPEVLTDEWIAAAGALGLTRASLGVQDLSPVVQAAVNRPESFDSIAHSAAMLRACGVTSLNLDLMYGLPLQGVEEVLATLEQVATLRPDRIALFGYAHVPWMKPHQKLIRDEDLPGPDLRFAQSEAARRFLIAHGWRAIGIDHFALRTDSLAVAAKGGELRRNFQGYTDDTAPLLIGLGASAISRSPQGYAQNLTVERDWRAAVGEGRLSAARGVEITRRDAFFAELIERLMCDFAVNLAAVAARHGQGLCVTGRVRQALDAFVADGMVRIDGGLVGVTETGRPFVRAICAAFDPLVQASARRHARVV